MSYTLYIICIFSIVIPVLVSWVRYRSLDARYLPFLILLWAGLTNEAISWYLTTTSGRSNAVPYNIYALLESVLVLWQFRNWGYFGHHTGRVFLPLLFLFTTVWAIENFILSDITTSNSYFISGYSFFNTLMSINMINKLIVTTRSSLLRNATFLICIAFIIYFTYSVLIEIFWMYGLEEWETFASRIYNIFILINLIANLIFAIAILWIPTKPRYIQPSS